ncbi:MAG: ATP-binding protein [Candidatus Peribacteraceae bacterium]
MNTKKDSPQQASYSSLRTSLFFQSFFLLAIAIVASTATAFALSWSELRSRSLSGLSALAESKANMFDATLASQREALSLYGRSLSTMSTDAITRTEGFRGLIHFPAKGEPTLLAGEVVPSEIESHVPNNFRFQQQTRFVPVVRDTSWDEYLILAPAQKDGIPDGVIVARFLTRPLAASITQVDSVGGTAEVLFVIDRGGEPLVLRGASTRNSAEFVIASADAGSDPVVVQALQGGTGIAEGKDYAGIPVVVASRSITSVGWAILVKVDRFEFMRPILRLAMNIVGIGFMLVFLLSLSTFFMSRRIVRPLTELAHKLQHLNTETWDYAPSIHTGNELELVDVVAVDLTGRLKGAYVHLEELVQERTQDLHKELAEKAAILASLGDGLIVSDADGVVKYMNHAASQLTGYTSDSSVGLHAHEVITLLNASGEALKHESHPVSFVMSNKASFAPRVDPQFTLRDQRGTHTAVHILASPILQEGICIGAVMTIRDMSDARRIDILKSEFISLVSHQLRTPLSSMRWYLELFTDDKPQMNDEQVECVTQIGLANTRMNNLVNALLNASRIELKKFQVAPTVVQVAHVLNVTIQTLALQLERKRIHVERNGVDDLPSLNTDPNLFALIIDNMISNAVKYSPEGASITVSGERDPETQSVLVRFNDHGIGIPLEEQKRIGQKLFRGANALQSDTDGNGLGLYISRLSAEAIGADISFQSETGRGTTFTVRVPIAWTGTKTLPSPQKEDQK